MGGRNYLFLLWNLLKSKRLAAVLILLLAVVATIGMVRPETEIFQTRWFAGLGIVFFTNLTSCTVQQIINSYRLWSKSGSLIKTGNNVKISTSLDIDGGGPKYRLRVKGRIGIWGAAVFHIGLILITVGAFVSGTMKMSGYIRVAEGETRYELHHDYEGVEEGPFFDESRHSGIGLVLRKQNIILDKSGDVDEIISDIAIIDNGRAVRTASLGEKEPVIYRGIRIFQKKAGFAPFLEITGPGNVKIANTNILLETDSSGEKARFYLDRLPLPNTPYILNIRFYPDMVHQGNEVTTTRYTLSNPGADITVLDEEQVVGEKIVRPGESMEFAGYRLKMGSIKHWAGFDIVNDMGANWVFAGSGVAVCGLALIYLFKKRSLLDNGQH
ncbi:MAG: cytochrome c biogenesis protein ResB [Firmicutes bacterium]|nr:cytochrome c biogenesis protein ResB [Bacillota bacterium]